MKPKKPDRQLSLKKTTVAHLSAEGLNLAKGGTHNTVDCTQTCDYCTIKSCIICKITEHPDYCGTIQP